MLDLEGIEDDENENEDEDKDEGEGEELACNMDDDADDDIDELDVLSGEEQATFLEATEAVKEAVTKVRTLPFTQCPVALNDIICGHQVRKLAFAIIYSTTIALPAWRRACKANQLKSNLIPRDVATRWNSTYDMLRFAAKYRIVVDSITADKTLKLRKFELDNDDWTIVHDLVSVLEVRVMYLYLYPTDQMLAI